MKPARTVVFLGLLILLSGCASMSKNECLQADWRLIGFEDGANGNSPAYISERRKACAKHGVTPDKTAYDQGYDEGIRVYCSYSRGLGAGRAGSPANGVCPSDSDYHAGHREGLVDFCTYDVGYTEALAGRSYRRVCPRELEAGFLRGYEFGREVKSLQDRLQDRENRLDAGVAELAANEREIATIKERVAYDESLDGDQRAELLEEVDGIEFRNTDLAVELSHLEEEIHHLQAELHRLTDAGH